MKIMRKREREGKSGLIYMISLSSQYYPALCYQLSHIEPTIATPKPRILVPPSSSSTIPMELREKIIALNTF